jgi:PAS domain S-box-containing protein
MPRDKVRDLTDGWKDLFDEAPHGIAILDPTHTVIAANRATLTAFDRREEEFLGRKCHELFHGSDRPDPGCPMVRLLSEGWTGSVEIEAQTVDRTFLVSCTPVRDEAGNIIRIVHMATDITELKKPQRALQKSEVQFRSLVETTSDWVWKIDKDGFYTYASPKVKDVLGYEPHEIMGKTPFGLMPEGEADKITALFRNIAVSLKPFFGLENINRCKNGRLVVIETNGTPIFDGQGNFAGYMGFDRDVTERKGTMEALIKREEELETKTVLLEEANTALKVLLRHREEDRRELEGMVLDNMKKLVFPYIERLKNGHLSELQMTCLNTIESNLDSIISPFQQRLAAANSLFTPTELQVADLIERGKTSKEIAKFLCVSKRTVDTHRDNIRGKLGLRSKKANLRAHLATLKTR